MKKFSLRKKTNGLLAGLRTFGRIFRYLRAYRFLFLLSVLLTVISVFSTLLIPVLVGKAVDLCIGEGSVDLQAVADILKAVGLCTAITFACNFLCNLINNRMTAGMVRRIRSDAFLRLQKMPVSAFDRMAVGDVLSRMMADTDTLSDGLLVGFSQFLSGVLTIVGTLLMMFFLHPTLTLLVLLLTPLSMIVSGFVAGKSVSLFKKMTVLRAEQTSLVDEMIVGGKTVRAFGREEATQKTFDDGNDRLSAATLRALFFSSLPNPSMRAVNNLIYALTVAVGALLCLSADGKIFGLSLGGAALTVGTLTSFLSYSTQYTKPFNEISGVFSELSGAVASGERILSLVESPVETDIPESGIPENAQEEKTENSLPCKEDEGINGEEKNAKIPKTGEVTFSHVCFSYDPEKPFMEDMNFTVPAGTHVAIVGPTGCGKTTLISLLMRFYDPTAGKIFLDGVDVRTLSRREVRRRFGMVLQETWLTSGTVRENLRFAKPDATDEEIVSACKAAHAHSFITRLPQGYDTRVGEGGGTISAGQRQLLCIARVMLTRPELLLLDEATSSIDTHTERRIQKAFEELQRGKTSFVVAHRLSTVRDADVIFVMKDGKIVETGTHDVLMKSDGLYRALYESQFAGKAI